MTIPEAARLVLLAGAFSKGRNLFVLNMGESVKIIGTRPGEKLYEELLIDDTSLSDTLHEKLLRANFEVFSQIEVAKIVQKVEEANTAQ